MKMNRIWTGETNGSISDFVFKMTFKISWLKKVSDLKGACASITRGRLKRLAGLLRQFTYLTLESLCGFLKLVHFFLEVCSSFGQKHEDVGLDFSTEDFRGSLQKTGIRV